jgi:hypothetical protein
MNEEQYLKSQNYRSLRENVLKKLDGIRATKGINPMTHVASQWMRALINENKVIPEGTKRQNITKTGAVAITKTQLKRPGEMFFFHYRPIKGANEYWDAFPLIFVTKVTKNGFYGINLHYLPSKYREVLFLSLSRLTIPNIEDRFTLEETDRYRLARLKITYELLKNTRRYRFFKPCYRKYKYSGVVGTMLLIEPKYWDIAIYLPLASFHGISKQELYRNTRRSLRNLADGN